MTVSVKDFGAVGDGISNDTDPFIAALAHARSNGLGLRIPAGTYKLNADGEATFPNFAGQGLHILGEDCPILQFVGSGRAFVMDTEGLPGLVIGEMQVSDIVIRGGANITDGLYSRGIVRSIFRNIEVREVTAKAFHILHAVSNLYLSPKHSTNVVAQTYMAEQGFVLDNNGEGYYSADNTILNVAMEGFPGIGIDLVDASGNLFLGGTSEAVTIGVRDSAACRRNIFQSLWLEANAVRDIEVYGTLNRFNDCYAVSNEIPDEGVQVVTAGGTRFDGGTLRVVELQSTSRDTLFTGVGFVAALPGIVGSGSFRRLGCVAIDANGDVSGTYGDIIAP